mgnify:CR=1 FL=1
MGNGREKQGRDCGTDRHVAQGAQGEACLQNSRLLVEIRRDWYIDGERRCLISYPLRRCASKLLAIQAFPISKRALRTSTMFSRN